MRHIRAALLCAACVLALSSAAQRPTRYLLGDSVILWDMNDLASVIPSLVYATDGSGIYVCQYANSFARFAASKEWSMFNGQCSTSLSYSIDQLVSVHEGLKYRITDVSPQGSTVALYIRKPSQPFTLYLNGHEADFPIKNDYICIIRPWNPQDEVWIDLQ